MHLENKHQLPYLLWKPFHNLCAQDCFQWITLMARREYIHTVAMADLHMARTPLDRAQTTSVKHSYSMQAYIQRYCGILLYEPSRA